jgi:hypothetical protein
LLLPQSDPYFPREAGKCNFPDYSRAGELCLDSEGLFLAASAYLNLFSPGLSPFIGFKAVQISSFL